MGKRYTLKVKYAILESRTEEKLTEELRVVEGVFWKGGRMDFIIGGADGPTGIFMLSGITLRHVLLSISSVVFGICHIYITCQNAKEEGEN